MNRSRVWMVGSLAAALCIQFLYARHATVPIIKNDSYQYLDAASNVLSDRCLCTSLAHFDEQLRWSRFPIPFTHFGAGYPLAMAALGGLGIPVETAGYLLSVAGYLVVVWLLWVAGSNLGLQPWCTAFLCVIWCLNFLALEFSASLLTESLFTAALMAVIALMAHDLRHSDRTSWVVFLGMGFVAGWSYWLRGAGIFVIAPVILYLAWRCGHEHRIWRQGAAGACLAVVMMAAVMIRNIELAGSWKGGFVSAHRSEVRKVLIDWVKVPYRIFFGTEVGSRLDVWAVLFVIAALLLMWRAVSNWRQRSQFGFHDSAAATGICSFLTAGIYAGGILLVTLTTIATDSVRYSFPILPVLLLGCGVLFQLAARGIGRVATIVFVVSLVVINVRSLTVVPPPSEHAVVEGLLEGETQPGVPMRTWIEGHLSEDTVLMAANGQAVHYLLKRPVVSLLFPGESEHTWDEADAQAVMRRFHAEYFMLFPGIPREALPVQYGSSFLADLVSGKPPSWLRLVARKGGVLVYHCAGCA